MSDMDTFHARGNDDPYFIQTRQDGIALADAGATGVGLCRRNAVFSIGRLCWFKHQKRCNKPGSQTYKGLDDDDENAHQYA